MSFRGGGRQGDASCLATETRACPWPASSGSAGGWLSASLGEHGAAGEAGVEMWLAHGSVRFLMGFLFSAC